MLSLGVPIFTTVNLKRRELAISSGLVSESNVATHSRIEERNRQESPLLTFFFSATFSTLGSRSLFFFRLIH